MVLLSPSLLPLDMPNTIAKSRRLPPSPLVLMNGSNTRACTSASCPSPNRPSMMDPLAAFRRAPRPPDRSAIPATGCGTGQHRQRLPQLSGPTHAGRGTGSVPRPSGSHGPARAGRSRAARPSGGRRPQWSMPLPLIPGLQAGCPTRRGPRRLWRHSQAPPRHAAAG